jgi:hypothetical protein
MCLTINRKQVKPRQRVAYKVMEDYTAAREYLSSFQYALYKVGRRAELRADAVTRSLSNKSETLEGYYVFLKRADALRAALAYHEIVVEVEVNPVNFLYRGNQMFVGVDNDCATYNAITVKRRIADYRNRNRNT